MADEQLELHYSTVSRRTIVQRSRKVRKGKPVGKPKRRTEWTPREIPRLIISGRWLEQAGFHAGMPVSIAAKPGLLVVCLVNPDPTDDSPV